MTPPRPMVPGTTDPPGRTRGVSKNTAEARRKLIASAIMLFGRQGFAATSTEEIAEQAGYGQATIFFHFKTKAGLLEACFDHTLERARSVVVPSDHSGVLDLVRRLDQAFDEAPLADFFARMMAELSGNPRFGPIYAAFHMHLRDLMEAELARESGAAREACTHAAAAVMSMMVGVHAEHRIAPGRFSRAEYGEMLLSVASLILNDLKRRNA